jgi:hypothetical protein
MIQPPSGTIDVPRCRGAAENTSRYAPCGDLPSAACPNSTLLLLRFRMLAIDGLRLVDGRLRSTLGLAQSMHGPEATIQHALWL